MKRKITIVIMITICLALSFIASNCKEKEHKTLYIDSETKAYCDFKKGSWWAYKEEQTGALDTIRLYNYDRRIVSEEDVHLDYEDIKMGVIWTSYGHDLTKANPFIRITADYYEDKDAYVEEQYPYEGFFPSSSIIFYPLDTVGDIHFRFEKLRYELNYDTLELEAKHYYQVKVISTNDTAFSKKQKLIYWVKNIGRIRFETFGGEVWNLVDHHVIK